VLLLAKLPSEPFFFGFGMPLSLLPEDLLESPLDELEFEAVVEEEFLLPDEVLEFLSESLPDEVLETFDEEPFELFDELPSEAV
jgi:hypothetical protein